ncbi:hypothetical protein D1872_236190 [compost metagenome]
MQCGDHIEKLDKRISRTRRQSQIIDSFKHPINRYASPACSIRKLGHRSIANSALWNVNDTYQTNIVIRVGKQPQIRKHIFDFFTIIELDPPYDLVRDIRFDENFLDDPRLGVRTIQYCVIIV